MRDDLDATISDIQVCVETLKKAWGEYKSLCDKRLQQKNTFFKSVETLEYHWQALIGTFYFYLLAKESADPQEIWKEEVVRFLRRSPFGLDLNLFSESGEEAKFRIDFEVLSEKLTSFFHTARILRKYLSERLRSLINSYSPVSILHLDPFSTLFSYTDTELQEDFKTLSGSLSFLSYSPSSFFFNTFPNTKERRLKGYWSLLEYKRQKYKERGKKKINHKNHLVYYDLEGALDGFLACMDCISGIGTLRRLLNPGYSLYFSNGGKAENAEKEVEYLYFSDFRSDYSWNIISDKIFSILKLKEAIALVRNSDTEVQEARAKVEQDIEEILSLYASEKVKRGISNSDDESKREVLTKEICEPLIELSYQLEAHIRALLLANDISLGVDQVRRAWLAGIKYMPMVHQFYLEHDFTTNNGLKTKLENLEREMFKPLEDVAFNMAVDLKLAEDVARIDLEFVLSQTQGAFLNYQQTYQQLQQEGIVTDKRLEESEKILDQARKGVEEILKTLSKNKKESIAQILQEALEKLWEGEDQALPLLEKILVLLDH
ncbi:hypothetical protein [Helicobacter suis]|uniref:hypothetical protein n=1 Tax=Helicobacter suis TaxID=104628 RepID=UPI0013D13633|nr:hypothetical protein [Helicobacter suis]